MSIRMCRWIAVVAVLALASWPATAQSTAKGQAAAIPRLADGKPDFNGVWDHPRVADVTRNSNECGGGTRGCKQEGTGELPFTEAGLQQWKDVEHRLDYSARCMPWGYTRAWQVDYPVEIVQTSKRIAILFESNNIFHVIPTDGRVLPKVHDEPTWMGKSAGRYEGDTLIIDTNGFNGKTWIDTAEHPMSDALHVNERIRHIDADHLSYEVTWTDPKTYTKPIQNRRIFSRMKPGEELMEYWCMENNKDLLEGHLTR